MLRLKVGNVFTELDPKTRVRIQRKNPLINRDVVGGEYVFPFTIPNNFEFLEQIGYKNNSQVEGFVSDVITAHLYEDETLLYTGILTIIEFLENSVNVSLKINTSKLALLKGKKLRDVDFGQINVAAQQQFIEWEIDNSYIGYPLQLILGQQTFIQYVTTTVDQAIFDLIDQINGTYYFGTTPVEAINLGGNVIRFEATWLGISPVLRAVFNTISMPSPPTATVIASSDVYQIYNDNWMSLMNANVTQSYPDVGFAFFPVLNNNSLIYPDDTTTLPIIEDFFQNLYDTVNGTFIPRNLFEVISGYFTPNSCVTPFMYLPYIFDKIASILNLGAIGALHSDTEFKRIVCWSNYFVDQISPYFAFDTNLSELVKLNSVAPDVTIEEFMTLIKDSLMVGYMINPEQKLEIVDLNKLLDADFTGVLDWSKLEVEKKRQSATNDYSGVSYTIELDELDLDNAAIKEDFDRKIYLGRFADDASLPVMRINEELDQIYFAFATAQNCFYMLYFNPITFVGYWDAYNEVIPAFEEVVNDGELIILKIADTCRMITGATSLIPSTSSWKVPLVKEEMSYNNNNIHQKNSKVRLLQFQGMQNDVDGVPYPLGNSESTNIDGTNVSNLSMKFIGENGLKAKRFDTWINFLRVSKPIEKYWDVTGLDLLEYDYKKMIFSNGSYYIIEEIQENRPIVEPTLFKVRKIEMNG